MGLKRAPSNANRISFHQLRSVTPQTHACALIWDDIFRSTFIFSSFCWDKEATLCSWICVFSRSLGHLLGFEINHPETLSAVSSVTFPNWHISHIFPASPPTKKTQRWWHVKSVKVCQSVRVSLVLWAEVSQRPGIEWKEKSCCTTKYLQQMVSRRWSWSGLSHFFKAWHHSCQETEVQINWRVTITLWGPCGLLSARPHLPDRSVIVKMSPYLKATWHQPNMH